MGKSLVSIISVPLIVVHLFILYFWLAEWERLATKQGIFVWESSIILGVLIFLIYQGRVITEKVVLIIKRTVLGTTLMVTVLAILAFMITFAVDAMP
ncbi:hypothetical protein SFC65_24105 [Priestia filamentosa]|uniref:hypothetical protein n=1 Tax=Priestia filamentosa TaxID=1402861 RepID=UPI0039827BFB